MRNHARKYVIAALMLAVALLPAVLNAGHQKESEAHSDNPLVEEMIKLDSVFREVVSGVAMGDGQRVHGALETMHGTMEKTHEGVHSGKVSIKKNANRLEEFVEMDKEFHGKLEKLAHAAQEGEQDEMLHITKELLEGCVECHRSFR